MINKIRRMELEELTHQIIGASMEVHRTLGNGFQERIYQRCLAFELRDRKLAYESEFSMKILYKGHFVGMRRVDFFVEKRSWSS